MLISRGMYIYQPLVLLFLRFCVSAKIFAVKIAELMGGMQLALGVFLIHNVYLTGIKSLSFLKTGKRNITTPKKLYS